MKPHDDRSLSELYRDMVQAEWFREAYEGRSWGDGIAVPADEEPGVHFCSRCMEPR